MKVWVWEPSEPLGFLVGNHNTITFKINTGDEPEKEKLNK